MVKKLNLFLLATLLFCTSFSLQAAPPYQISDSSFEDWSGSFDGEPALANTWHGANVTQTALGMTIYGQVVYRTSDAHSGKYAAKLMDTEVGAMGITETSPSWVTLGSPWSYIDGLDTGSATAGTDGGIAFTARPDAMAVWVKRVSEGTEHINLVYYSWKGTARSDSYKSKSGGCSSTSHTDEESDIRITTDPNSCGTKQPATQIGEGHFQTSKQYKDWTEIIVPIKYYNDEVPQKMNVILSASNYPEGRRNDGLYAGNYLIVDDLRFIYSSHIDEIRVGGKPYTEFQSDIYEYEYGLGEKATEIPEIRCKRSGRTLTDSELEIQMGEIGEFTTIKVKAEDGSSTTTYKIKFSRAKSKNSRPAAISINGEKLAGFNGYNFNYDVELPYGTTHAPEITVEKAEEEQTVQVTTCVPGCIAKVKVTAADGITTSEYILNLSIGELTDNTLKDILIGGKSLEGYKPNSTAYTVYLPTGTTETPKIEAVSAYEEGLQKIEITNNGFNSPSTIVVTPPAGQSRTYRITFKIQQSSNSYLNNILLDGVAIEGFAPDKLNYDITLPVGTTTLPAITWEKGDEYQTVDLQEGTVNGISRITVTAQDGSISLYRLSFTTQKSSNALLNNIYLDGVALEGFNKDVFNYAYTVPSTAATRPVVTWDKGDEFQTVSKSPVSESSAPISGETKLTVRAEDGSFNIYVITFSQNISSNSNLASLSVAGAELSPAFSPDVYEYTCTLGRGVTSLPTISYTKGDETQTVRVVEGGINGETKITVKAQSGAVSVYTIKFSAQVSANADLAAIYVGGNLIEGFDPKTLEYNYNLPSGTTVLPAITTEKGDYAQTVYNVLGGVNGETKIIVVAEDGTSQTYIINFSVEKSANALLKNILVGGVAIEGFDPEVFAYTYVITPEMDFAPIISTESYPGQTVNITQPKLYGTARIEVTPEAGASNVYTILFTAPLSSDNKLASIEIDGALIDGFDPSVNAYVVELEEGTTTVPVITYTAGDEKQVVELVNGGLNANSVIYVVAENGVVNTYTIQFVVKKSDSAALKMILLDGAPLENFTPEVTDYTVILPLETTTLPEIAVEKASVNQVVQISKPILDGVTNIYVYSATGTVISEYHIVFAVEKSSVSTLASITADGVELPGFSPEQTEYTIEVQHGSIPQMGYVKGYEKQFVSYSVADKAGIEYIVTAENGDTKIYDITFNIINSNNTELNSILLYNSATREYEPLADFASDKYEYEIELPWRTSMLPPMLPVGKNEQQVISVDEGGINGDTKITVLAGDKEASQEYVIKFSTKKSNVSSLSMIYLNDEELTDFNEETTDYVVELPYGSTSVPVITYSKAKTNDGSEIWEQKVYVEYNGFYSPSKIKVTAEDGTEKVYSITFKVKESEKENVLTGVSYLVNDELVTFPFEAGKYEYTVVLPYGTTDVPDLIINKSYPEQTYSASVPVFGKQTIIDVYSNKTVNEKVTYKVTYEVEKNKAVLLGIGLPEGSTLYPAFSEDVKEYVAVIPSDKSTSNIVFHSESYNSIEKTINKSNFMQLSVTNTNNTSMNSIYKIYVHYKGDVIPNNDFTDWTGTQYNGGNKPKGWNAPSDYVENYYAGFGTTDFTKAVQKTSTAGEVKLNTQGINLISGIGGPFPGMMTLGTMNIKLASANESTSSISGGIKFRNTPDNLSIRYKFENNSQVDSMRFIYTLSDGTNSYTYVYGDKNQSSSYKEKTISLSKSNVSSPTIMNLTINSSQTENAKDLGRKWNDLSILYVDWVRFSYTSTISGVIVNGVEAKQNNLNGTIFYTVTLPDAYDQIPNVEVIGDVEDQSYGISWDAAYKNATITSYAEDGSSSSYTLIVTRNDNLALADLYVDGVVVPEFAPNKTEYNLLRKNGDRKMPDVIAEASSYHQNVVVNNFENKSEIVVTAESGATRKYVINFVESKSNDATLKSLAVEGYDIAFNPAVNEYTVVLPAETTITPAISFVKQSEGQTVVFTEGGVNAVTTIKVFAEDGIEENANIYSIAFNTEAPVVSTALSMINIEGAELVPAFSEDIYEYTCKTPLESQVSVYYEVKDKNAKLDFQLGESSMSWSLIPNEQTNLGNTPAPTVYTLTFTRDLSTNANLKDITINGESLDGFLASINDYTYNLNRGEHVEIVAVPAEENQVIYVTYDASTLTYSFKVVAEDSTIEPNVYTVKLEYNKSADATLSTILIDGVQIDGFSPDRLEYDYVIPASNPKLVDPAMPMVEAFANANAQVLDIEYNGINGTTYITVKAESGAEKVYSIDFSVEKSSNSLLKDLSVNYVTIPGFDPEVFEYTVPLSATSAQPVITYEKSDAYQTVTETVEMGVNILTVKAEDGTTSVYKIIFETEYNRNTRLDDIIIAGESLEGFNPEVFSYKYELPVGTKELPEILVISAVDGQIVTVEEGGVNGLTLITVKADDRISSTTYIINFSVKQSDVDYLLDIKSAGEILSDFASDKFDYTVELPVGTTTLPIITWTPGDEYQTVDTLSIKKDKWNTEIRLTAKAENGLSSNVYKVNYQVLKSSDATLKTILVDEMPIDNFDPSVFDYVIELPVGTTEYPEVSYEKSDDFQNVTKLVANEKLTIFNVIAEDGSTQTYSVTFTVKLSENVELASIELDEVPLQGFEPNKLEYTYVLGDGATSHPAVVPVPMDDYQKIEVEDNGVYGDYKIYVAAQNGNKQVYVIHFVVEKSTNATLTDILADGESIPNYDSEIFNYNIVLPYGSTRVPIITYVSPLPKLQTITVTQAKSLTEVTTIEVVAEDEAVSNVYTISYQVEKSSNSILNAIYLDDALIEGFDVEEREYYVSLPYGTETLPTVTVEQGDADQNVTITSEGLQTYILVTAQDGETMSEYYIYYSIDKNSENRLKNLSWNGKTIIDFKPTVQEYILTFPAGTTVDELPKVEQITYEVFDSTEIVSVVDMQGNIIVSVTAENGDLRTYAIVSEILLSDDTHLEAIYINGELIDGFNPNQLEYEYRLPFGAVTAQTEITYEKGSEEQEVVIAINPINEPTDIFVTAEDGTTVRYRIHYVVSTFNPTTVPNENNVCVVSLPDGKWRFTTDCHKVDIVLANLSGQRIHTERIEIVDPNCYNLCDENAEGVVFHPEDGQIIIYYFVYNETTIIKSGKFRSIINR